MTKKLLSKIAALTAAAAIASGQHVITASALSDYIYYPDYDVSSVDVSADETIINPDKDGYLDFTVFNKSNRNIRITSPISENCFVQKYTSDQWITVYGSEFEAVPLSEYYYDYEDGTIYYYEDDDIDYDDDAIYYYEDDEYLPPYFSYTDSLDVSEFEDGDYRMGFYTDYYNLNYLYFTVRRSISATLTESRLFTESDSLEIKITNNLPCDTEVNLDPSLTVLEKYTSGKWKTIEPDEYPDYYQNPILSAYETDIFSVDLSPYGELSKGEYRLSLGWNTYDSLFSDGDSYGSCTVNFKITEPMTMKIIPTSSEKQSDMRVRVKITNNADKVLRIYDYGRLEKRLGTNWYSVRFKSNAKELSNYTSIAPGKSRVIEIKLDDYYYVKTLGAAKYRMEIPANGKTYYCTFTLSHGKYYTIK